MIGPSFDRMEACELLALCAVIENAVQPPISQPSEWNLLFDSPEIGPLKNKWQLWRKGSGPFAIVLRGTTMEPGSILEDLISLLVEATGSIKIGNYAMNYKFASDPEAGVHLGFALGTLLLLNDPQSGILAKLETLVNEGSDVFIAGHSQGAALGTLLRSYFHYNPNGLINSCSFKTYVYAQPKPGNDHYAEDFEANFCIPELAFRVTNTFDWVPQVPFTLQSVKDINTPNPLSTSPPLILTLIKNSVISLINLIELQARHRLHPTAVWLVHAGNISAGISKEELLPMLLDVPILPSLNFVNAGIEFPLAGIPCSGNQCLDSFFEHHASTYYKLLCG